MTISPLPSVLVLTRLAHSVAMAFLLVTAARGQIGDVALVKDRIRQSLSTGLASASTIHGYQNTLQADGTWPDISYTSTAQTLWPPQTHLARLKEMAKCFVFGSLQGDSTLRNDVLRAYDAWITHDPQSSNWWYNQISTPQYLGEILLLVESDFSAARMASGITIINRSYIARTTNSGTNTGANRVDRAYATMMRGLLAGDSALTSEAFLAIGDTIIVNRADVFAEGIQPDQSFQQHGAQLYVQGYGSIYTAGVLKYASWGAGTAFGYRNLQIRVLVDHLLDGSQWFIRGNTVEYTSAGRGLTRPNSASGALSFSGQLANALAIAGGYRTAELEAFRQRLLGVTAAGAAEPSAALVGNRNFWRADMVVHHRPGFSVSVKTSSTRTYQPETGNGEGLKNLHLGDGVTLIQRSGNEYDDIMPVWDWRRLPGTTTEQGTYSLKPATDWGVYGTSTHAGGVSDGEDGSAVFQYSRLGVSAKKSWFFLGDVMVALGAAINAPTAANPVLTTINQARLAGAVTYRTASGTNTLSGTATSSGLQWVHHDGVGYFFPGGASNATIAAETQTGNWQSINNGYTADPVNLDVFSLHVSHGTAVSGASYAYLVAPGLEAAGMDAFPLSNYEILRNDGTVQAVKDHAAGKTSANFWAAASVGGLSCDSKACILMKQDSAFLDLCVSDPTQTNTGSIVVETQTPAAGLIRADGGITVEQMTPTLRIRVAVSASRGRSFKARFYLRPNAFETLVREPTADAFVYDGGPTTNYGTATTLTCKLLTASSSYTREAFLRFDLTDIGRTPVAASLRLSPVLVQTAGIHTVQAVADNTWSETGINWNNRPYPSAAGTAFWLPVTSARTSSDVLPAVIARSGGALNLSVTTHSPTNDGLVNYASRENADSSLRPTLELVVPRPEIDIWRIERFGAQASDPAVASDPADPDGDGIANAIEFVLGGEPNPANPGSDSTRLLPALRCETDHLIFSFRRTHTSAACDVFAEHGNDLTGWARVVDGVNGAAVQTEPDAEGAGIDRVSVSIPRQAGTNQFVRLAVCGGS